MPKPTKTTPQTIAALGQPLARGNTAEIFAWGSAQVLKLYRPDFSADAVNKEASLARTVYAAGLRVPAVGDLIMIENRHGLIYERIVGPPLLDQLGARPWRVARIAQTMAQLHTAIHARPAPTIPPLHQRLERNIQNAKLLSNPVRQSVLGILQTLPDANQLCHNDFHPANILMADQGPVIIDWMDAARADPLADVARTLILVHFAGLPASGPLRLAQVALRRLLSGLYLRRYFQLRPGQRNDLAHWMIPVAAARLMEGVGEEAQLARYVEVRVREIGR